MGIVWSSECTALARFWLRENFLSANLSCKGGKSQKSHSDKVGTVRWVWQELDIFSLKILSYGACFAGTSVVMEKEDVLGGDGWTTLGKTVSA